LDRFSDFTAVGLASRRQSNVSFQLILAGWMTGMLFSAKAITRNPVLPSALLLKQHFLRGVSMVWLLNCLLPHTDR